MAHKILIFCVLIFIDLSGPDGSTVANSHRDRLPPICKHDKVLDVPCNGRRVTVTVGSRVIENGVWAKGVRYLLCRLSKGSPFKHSIKR